MIFAFAPITAFLLGVSDVTVPWDTLVLSVILYVLIPLLAGIFTRKMLDSSGNHERLNYFLNTLKPVSITGLLATVVLLFGFPSTNYFRKPAGNRTYSDSSTGASIWNFYPSLHVGQGY